MLLDRRPAAQLSRSCRKLAGSSRAPNGGGRRRRKDCYVNEPDDWQSALFGLSSSAAAAAAAEATVGASMPLSAAGRSRLEPSVHRLLPAAPAASGAGSASKWDPERTKEVGGAAALAGRSSVARAGLEWLADDWRRRNAGEASREEWEVCLINYVRPWPLGRPFDTVACGQHSDSRLPADAFATGGGAAAAAAEAIRLLAKFKFHRSSALAPRSRKAGKISKLAANNTRTTSTKTKPTTTTTATTTKILAGAAPSNRLPATTSEPFALASARAAPESQASCCRRIGVAAQVNITGGRATGPTTRLASSRSRRESIEEKRAACSGQDNKSGSPGCIARAAIYLGGGCQLVSSRCAFTCAALSPSAASSLEAQHVDGCSSVWSDKRQQQSGAASDEPSAAESSRTARWAARPENAEANSAALLSPAARKEDEQRGEWGEERESPYLPNSIAFCLCAVGPNSLLGSAARGGQLSTTTTTTISTTALAKTKRCRPRSGQQSGDVSGELKIGQHLSGCVTARSLQDEDARNAERSAGVMIDRSRKMNEMDTRARLKKATMFGRATTTTTNRGEKRGECRYAATATTAVRGRENIRTRHAHPAQLTRLLLAALLVCAAAAHSEAASSSGGVRPHPKRAVWMEALGVALAGREQPEGVERLADRLANWPDQQQATLFYLSLLARSSRSAGLATDASSSSAAASWCRSQISLGALLSASAPSSPKDAELRLPLAPAGTGRREAAVKLMDNADARLADAAKLAVENANLISRLLIHQEESEVIRQISSQRRFLYYLLETKLGSSSLSLSSSSSSIAAMPPASSPLDETTSSSHSYSRWQEHHQQPRQTDNKQQQRWRRALDALGLVFLSAGSGTNQSVGDEDSPSSDTQRNKATFSGGAGDEILFAPVARRRVAGGSSSRSIESRDLAPLLNARNGSSWASAEFVRRWTMPVIEEEELASMSSRLPANNDNNNSNNNDDDGPAPIARASDGLDWRDGRWFFPRLDCGLSNKWMLTYSVPFFGPAVAGGGQKALRVRGVAYVNLDAAQLGLVDQCARREAPVLFGGTHRCASRLRGSQCVTLAHADGAELEFRGGNYICQCAPGSSAQPATQHKSVQQHRDRLAEIVLNPPPPPPPAAGSAREAASSGRGQTTTSGQALDKLLLEPEDERLTDKVQLGARLLARLRQKQAAELSGSKQNYSSPPADLLASTSHYFIAGAQLDADAALGWFASATMAAAAAATPAPTYSGDQPRLTDDDDALQLQPQPQPQGQAENSIRLDWPEQVCRRRCGPSSLVRGAPADSNDYSDSPAAAATCGQTSGPSVENQTTTDGAGQTPAGAVISGLIWLRPLVLALQSACTLTTLCLIGILFRLRKSRIILVSGWLMLETTLLGGLILYSSVIVRYFEPTSLTCLVEPWLRELGFSIFYGSILIKLYRILTEFQTRKAHRVCFRDKDQVVYLLAIVLIVIGYMSAWTALMVDGFLFGGHGSHDSSSSSSGSIGSGETVTVLDGSTNLGNGVGGSTSTLSSTSVIFLEQATQIGGGGGGKASPATTVSSSNQAELFETYLGNDADSSASRFVSTPSSSGGANRKVVDQLAEYAPEQLRIFARNLDSFGELFSGLLERSEPKYDESSESFVTTMRCRKLTWDYVTELSEMGLLVFGIYLVYKLRNANSDVHKEKLALCAPIFIELLVSGCTYSLRHAFWRHLGSNQLLALYFIRCQLTVTVTLALVVVPKLWLICKSKPNLFRQAAAAGNAAASAKGSARHRCHLTCELHDHHLNDAMRLHQAMLSNSALDIGSIDLADMDPDEIQAELKRVYAQLEILKTKIMRRDNPHISKRRGGRKTSHRKFSLQAFHPHRHASCQQQQSPSQSQSRQSQSQSGQKSLNCSSAAAHNNQHSSAGSQKLPVLLESQSELSSDQQHYRDSELAPLEMEPVAESISTTTTSRRVRMETPSSGSEGRAVKQHHYHHAHHLQHQQQQQQQHHHHHQHHQHHHHHNHHHRQQQQAANNKCGTSERDALCAGRNLVSADPNSTSSGGGVYFDDETIIMNDSQSSGNVSPQRRSSFVCSQSSIHPDDSSLN